MNNSIIQLTSIHICRFILHAKKTAFVVEHDFIMATYLADRVIVFEGQPSVEARANAPQALLPGMNRFLELLAITFRRDPNNYRPRINKENSVKVFFFQKWVLEMISTSSLFHEYFPYRTWSRRDRAITFSWRTRKGFLFVSNAVNTHALQTPVKCCWVKEIQKPILRPAF